MLRERLQAVFDFIDECESLIDIGTDHAYIPIECVESGKAKRALAADINVGPVNIAEKNINKYGLGDAIKTAVSDGFEKLGEVKADAVVIAGMGGTLISEILGRGMEICPERFTEYKQIVLQPMNDIEDLRRWLFANSFSIIEERLVAEETKIYCLMKVEYKKCLKKIDGEHNLLSYLLGGLVERRDVLMMRFVDKMIKRRERILAGFACSREAHDGIMPDNLRVEGEQIERELKILKEWVEVNG